MNKKHRAWLESYLLSCQQLNKSAHTITNYRSDLEKFLKWYEISSNKLITKADGNTITIYKDFLTVGGKLQKKSSKIGRILKGIFTTLFFLKTTKIYEVTTSQTPLAVASRRRHLSAVKNFFEFLKQTHEDNRKIFLINPVKSKIHGIKLKDIDVQNTKMLKFTDWQKLEDKTYRTNERLLCLLLYFGGLRLSELCDLQINDFDFKSKTIKFKRKGGSVHTLAIQKADYIFKQLNFYLINRKVISKYLFSNKRGHRVSSKTMYNMITTILKKCGCESGLSPHSFRKACATNLYLRYKDLLLVRDYLNHSDAKVTQTYIDQRTLYAKSKIIMNNI